MARLDSEQQREKSEGSLSDEMENTTRDNDLKAKKEKLKKEYDMTPKRDISDFHTAQGSLIASLRSLDSLYNVNNTGSLANVVQKPEVQKRLEELMEKYSNKISSDDLYGVFEGDAIGSDDKIIKNIANTLIGKDKGNLIKAMDYILKDPEIYWRNVNEVFGIAQRKIPFLKVYNDHLLNVAYATTNIITYQFEAMEHMKKFLTAREGKKRLRSDDEDRAEEELQRGNKRFKPMEKHTGVSFGSFFGKGSGEEEVITVYNWPEKVYLGAKSQQQQQQELTVEEMEMLNMCFSIQKAVEHLLRSVYYDTPWILEPAEASAKSAFFKIHEELVKYVDFVGHMVDFKKGGSKSIVELYKACLSIMRDENGALRGLLDYMVETLAIHQIKLEDLQKKYYTNALGIKPTGGKEGQAPQPEQGKNPPEQPPSSNLPGHRAFRAVNDAKDKRKNVFNPNTATAKKPEPPKEPEIAKIVENTPATVTASETIGWIILYRADPSQILKRLASKLSPNTITSRANWIDYRSPCPSWRRAMLLT